MADVASAAGPLSGPRLRAAVHDVFAGLVCSALSIAYCVSYAALIFAGPLSRWLSYGIAVTFLSAAIAGAIVSWRSSLAFTIAGPDSSTSAVVAALLATMAQRLVATGYTDLLPPVLIVMAAATGVTGLMLCGLGLARAGRAIRFVPFPVIGGFMAATGWLVFMGAIGVVTGHKPTFGSLADFAGLTIVAKLAAAVAVAAALEILGTRWPSPFILPGVLLLALVAAHAGFAAAGVPVADAQSAGWLFQPESAAPLMLPWQIDALANFPYRSLSWLVGDLLAVLFVTVISILLNTTGVEIATKREADIDGELKALGLANLVTCALGGYVSCLSLSRTSLNYNLGGRSRISGLTVAAISALVLVADPGFLGFIPRFAVGGVLLITSMRLLRRWIVQSVRQLSALEYFSLLAVVLIIVQWGFIAGVLIGVVIGCATFAVSASRVNAIKFSFDGSEYRSHLDRSPEELAILAQHGRELQGMSLQSYLFFGSANKLYQHVKALLQKQTNCRFLVFDFRLVTGLDSSATHSFSQIKQVASEGGARLVLVNLTPELQRTFQTIKFLSADVMVAPDLDRALEVCEDAVIAAHRAEGTELDSLRVWLAKALGSADYADALAALCRRFEARPGDIIARQGEPSNSMHFILDGRVGILVDMGEGRTVRVRSLGRHTIIGEMGLISGRPRSATIQAEAESVLYELSLEHFNDIKRTQPALGQALLSYVISVMAERLSFASRVIGVLQR
jgi:SulP family sulfate permease